MHFSYWVLWLDEWGTQREVERGYGLLFAELVKSLVIIDAKLLLNQSEHDCNVFDHVPVSAEAETGRARRDSRGYDP